MWRLATLVALLVLVPLGWNPLRGQAPSLGIDVSKSKKENAKGKGDKPGHHGSEANPLVVDTQGHKENTEEAAKAQKKAAEAKALEDWHHYVDTRMIRYTGIAAIATAILVLVGIVGALLAKRTLGNIDEQTKAIKASVEALINSERAWVLVRPMHADLIPVTPGAILPYNMFRFSMVNKGKTVAKLIRFQSGGRLVLPGQTLNETPVYDREDGVNYFASQSIGIHSGGVFAPDESNDMAIAINAFLTADKIAEIDKGGLWLYIFGRIEYFDFAEVSRVVQFCYTYASHAKDFDGTDQRWLLAGPAAYNTHT